MSRRPTSEGSSAEPNLTPLLDLVLQLIMFFMITVNFVSEQITGDVQLPDAQSARPMDKTGEDVLFLNMDGEGKVIVFDRPKPMSLLEAKYYLKTYFEDIKRLAKDEKVRITRPA